MHSGGDGDSGPRDEREIGERGELCVPARAHGATAAPMAAAAVPLCGRVAGGRGHGFRGGGEVVGFDDVVGLVAVQLAVVVELSACSRHDINIAPDGKGRGQRRGDDIEIRRHRSFNAADGYDSARQLQRLQPPPPSGKGDGGIEEPERRKHLAERWGARRSWPALVSRRPSSEVGWRREGETQGRLRA